MRVFKCIVRGRSILSALCIFHNYLLFWRCVTLSSKELQINEEIRDKDCLLYTSGGLLQCQSIKGKLPAVTVFKFLFFLHIIGFIVHQNQAAV